MARRTSFGSIIEHAATALCAFGLTFPVVASAQALPDWTINTEPRGRIRANYDTPIKVTARDRKGNPVSGATVELVVTMVEMDHGEHKSAAKATAPGVYEGQVKFFMVGAWNLRTRVTKGKESKTQTTRIDVKE